MRPPGISANGGAIRYWRHPWGDDFMRAVLCRNGQILVRYGRKAWRSVDWTLTTIEQDPTWVPDTRSVVRGATTRTGRQARREEG